MPIYEYQREDGTVFEINQSIKDDPLEVCPETGQKVKKIISKNAFHLKGGGWYKTDYTSSGNSSSSSQTAESSSSDTKSSDSSSDKGGSDKGGSGSCGGGCSCH